MDQLRPLLVCALLVAPSVACTRGSGVSGPSYHYDPCTSDATCEEGSTCNVIAWRDGSGGLCTSACTAANECPYLGRCLDVTSAFLCYEPCIADTDCPSGFICQPISTGGAVCLPS